MLVPVRHHLRASPLETARLVLEPVDLADVADLWIATEASRRELEPWLPWVPFCTDVDGSHRYADASMQDWDSFRACRFTIRQKVDRRLIGVVGLEAFSHLPESTELGYWLRTDSTGRGFMTEACKAILTWSFEGIGAHRVRIAAATDNHASLAVISRLGFRFEGIAREAERCAGRWHDHAIFALLSSDPRPR